MQINLACWSCLTRTTARAKRYSVDLGDTVRVICLRNVPLMCGLVARAMVYAAELLYLYVYAVELL
jgi:hypothetical protein